MKPIKKEKPRAKSKLKTRSTKISPRKKTPDFNIQESQLKQMIEKEIKTLIEAESRLMRQQTELDRGIAAHEAPGTDAAHLIDAYIKVSEKPNSPLHREAIASTLSSIESDDYNVEQVREHVLAIVHMIDLLHNRYGKGRLTGGLAMPSWRDKGKGKSVDWSFGEPEKWLDPGSVYLHRDEDVRHAIEDKTKPALIELLNIIDNPEEHLTTHERVGKPSWWEQEGRSFTDVPRYRAIGRPKPLPESQLKQMIKEELIKALNENN